MALKVNFISSSGHAITYADIYEIRIVNIRGGKYAAYTLRGWETKEAYLKGYSADYLQTYRVSLDDTAPVFASLYAGLISGAPELSGALPVYDVSRVTLSSSELSLSKGQTSQLSAVCTPDTAGDLSVLWSVSDPLVASVDTSGLVTALSPGATAVTAVSRDEPSVSASCTVTVT